MSDPLLPLIDANLVESVREFARWQKGGEIVERDGVLLIAGTTRFPVVSNAALRLDPLLSPQKMLETALGFFRDRRRGFTVWVRPGVDDDTASALGAAGFHEISSSPWMVLDAPLRAEPLPDGLEIREARTEREVLDARDVNREAYLSIQMPPAEVDAVYGRPHHALHAAVRIFVGYREGRPVATAMILFTHAVAGIYWVGTVEAARGRGYAAALTRHASNAGFDDGARVVTLQASVMGEPIYRRLGYRTVGRQKWFLSPKPKKD